MKFPASVSCQCGTAMCAFGIATGMVGAEPSKYDHDIAVYERLIAEIQPGQLHVACGDYGLTPAQLQTFHDELVARRNGGRTRSATPATVVFWTGGTVNYRFDATQVGSGTITASKMRQFRDSVNEWAAFANLQFIEFTGTPPANYITVGEDPNSSGGYSSSVGMGGGEQQILIGPMAWNRGTICHEMGHVLGLVHEHQRDDRDSYISVFPENYLPGADGNFTLIPGGTTMYGPYDFYSVMHYERNLLSVDPAHKDTIEPKVDYISYLNIIGRVTDRTLSKLDRAGIATMYGNPSSLPSATVTNTNDSGPGSLRTAIYYAFDKSTDMPAVPTAVQFHIPVSDPNYNAVTGVFTIRQSSQLTAPGAGTTIDGATQTAFTGNTNPAGPEIALDGTDIGASNLGIYADGLVLRESNCTVRNLIVGGFNSDGVYFNGDTAAINGVSCTGNVVAGCYIGTDRTGTMAIGNGTGYPGIELEGGAHDNTIGGTTADMRNVISGNGGHGVLVRGAGTNGNVVKGNYIGTDAAGAAVLSNGFAGVSISEGAQQNVVGGTASGARNVISGNSNEGVVVVDSGTTGNKVQGNYIGTDAAASGALGNGQSGHWAGVSVYSGAQGNLVGGTVTGAANVISGNTGQGVAIGATNTNMNLVQGNLIGTNPMGAAAIPNVGAGVLIYRGAQSNVVGGTSAAARNVISGNHNQGVVISEAGSDLNYVQGNYIGTDRNGTVALPNDYSGVSVFGGAQSNTIGGAAPGARNVISGNANQGITLSDAGTASNVVSGNYIGLDATGLAALANQYNGVDVFGGSHANVIGGTVVGSRNYISGNAGAGLGFSGMGTNSNLVQGNTIGLNVSGAFAGNGNQGISMFQSQPADPSGPQFNVIGGMAVGASNLIAGNTYQGIAIFDPGTIKNRISGNSIHSNHDSGIGMGASFNNSSNNQSAPSLASATVSAVVNPNGTDIDGTLFSIANTTFRIEFFANPAGTQEGKSFIGSTSVTSNGSGVATFATVHLAAVTPVGSAITCTATDANGNTSSFSGPIPATTTDTDGDGVPDNWTNLHFGHLTGQMGDHSRADDDADGDGMTNLQEFLAGTDPKDGASALRVTSVARNGGDFTFTFTSTIGKTYRVEASDDLASSSWQILVDQLFAAGASVTIADPADPTRPRRFYRAALEP